jgi:ankyrin repeat protein
MAMVLRTLLMTALVLPTVARAQADPTTALFDAIESEDIAAAQAAIATGQVVWTQQGGRLGYVPLTDAAQQGNAKLFQVVLDAAPDINVQDKMGRTALITAVWLDQMDVLQVLLPRHPKLDVPDRLGDSALFYAERTDGDEMLRMLVQAGANVNLVNQVGQTALSQAMSRSQFNNAQLLRAAGAHFADAEDELVGAASSGDIATLTRLLDVEHADANFHRRYGQPVLCIAAQKGNTVAVKVLLAHGADPNLRDSNQQPPLYWALVSGHASTVQALMDAGANLLAETPVHRTLLATLAYYVDDVALAQRLLDAGVDVNRQDYAGGTALMNAASAGKLPVVAFLLHAGADPTLRNTHGQTAADFARKRGDSNVVERLTQAEIAWPKAKH